MAKQRPTRRQLEVLRVHISQAMTSDSTPSIESPHLVSQRGGSATYRERFIKARLEPYVESASIAGSGSIFSPLIPWNVHGAFVAGTLGIGVLAYAPYAVLLWLTPVVLIGVGIARFSHDSISGTGAAEEAYGTGPQELPKRRTSV
jgi:NhaC family Na+:H+ antiporter